jgi:hypothetical protein
MTRRIVILLLTATLISPAVLVGRSAAQDRVPPSLPALLERAGQYVVAFEEQFAQVVGFERYRQEVHALEGGEMVDLESEVFFVGIDDRRTWLTVRHVLTVNGRAVADSSDSVIDLLIARGNSARLRELADAGARYNVGSVRRNFNDPTLALLFLAPSSRQRFRFSDRGSDTVDGIAVRVVAFEERERPTIVRDARTRRDAPSSGLLLIADDGRVLRSELSVQIPRSTTASIKVTYGFEPKLEMMVPLLMEEEYRALRTRGTGELITGRASYSNYRRFQTGVRILPPEQEH